MDITLALLVMPALVFILSYAFSFYEYRVWKKPTGGTPISDKVYVLTMDDYRSLRRGIEQICIFVLLSLLILYIVMDIDFFSAIPMLALLTIFVLSGIYIVFFIRSTAVEFYRGA